MGRPTKLTPEVQQTIVTFMGTGAYIETAAKTAGICKKTLYNWLDRGADGEQPFEEFLHAVEKAAGEADLRDLKTIREAAQRGQWQAAAWRLERRHPGQWGRGRRDDAEDAPSVPILIDDIPPCDGCALEQRRSLEGAQVVDQSDLE